MSKRRGKNNIPQDFLHFPFHVESQDRREIKRGTREKEEEKKKKRSENNPNCLSVPCLSLCLSSVCHF